MISIFSIPKPFQGLNNIIQRNALKSWLQLTPLPEVILFGDDDGVERVADEFAIRHIPNVEKNEYGTPILSDVFKKAQKICRYDFVSYVNADIIFFQDFIRTISMVKMSDFLLCGRRFDLDIKEEINFNEENILKKMSNWAKTEGTLHGYSGIDYFLFPRGLVYLPPFAVGRTGWDNWLIYNIRLRRIPVIDATDAITVIHQNHDYSHSKFGTNKRVAGPEMYYNVKIAGGLSRMLTLREADWMLTQNGLQRPGLLRKFYSSVSLWQPWRNLLVFKRTIQHLLR